jgi:CO/xanthine dehydrogenase FAD-binding subunit
MQGFQFHSASSIEEALGWLSEGGERRKLLAGGTDLVPKLRLEEIRPEGVLNILEIAELKGIRETKDGVWIGPTSTFTELIDSALINRLLPLLAQAASSVGAAQIRNRGTVGGNIANGSPAADLLPALVALSADLELRSKMSGSRRVPVAGAIKGPYQPLFRPDEMITGILIRSLKKGTRTCFEKLGQRNAMARAQMSLSMVLALDGEGNVSDLRIVPGAVLPVARRMGRAEKALVANRLQDSTIQAAVDTLAQEVSEEPEVRVPEYKIPVLKNMAARLLRQLSCPPAQ